MTLTASDARQLIDKAIAAAESQGVAVVASVVDSAGHVVALARMDGVSFLNTEMASRKALLAAAFGAPTHGVQAMTAADPILAASLSTDSRISLLPGGLPVLRDGRCVAGLGIAGGHYSQDQAVAEAALG